MKNTSIEFDWLVNYCEKNLIVFTISYHPCDGPYALWKIRVQNHIESWPLDGESMEDVIVKAIQYIKENQAYLKE